MASPCPTQMSLGPLYSDIIFARREVSSAGYSHHRHRPVSLLAAAIIATRADHTRTDEQLAHRFMGAGTGDYVLVVVVGWRRQWELCLVASAAFAAAVYSRLLVVWISGILSSSASASTRFAHGARCRVVCLGCSAPQPLHYPGQVDATCGGIRP